jgi:hypothetical protein
MNPTHYSHHVVIVIFIIVMITLCLVIQSRYAQSVRIQNATHTIAILEQEYTILQHQLQNKKAEHQVYEQKLAEWNNRAASSSLPHEVIYQILDIASTSTIMCMQVKQHQSIVHPNYTKIPVTFRLHGSFEHVLLFFDHLETVTALTIQEALVQATDDHFMLDVMMKVYTTTFHAIIVGNEFHNPRPQHPIL